ncbi:MAG: nuclear transport factor 2 family protein [Pseudomonadota bacterium]
MPSAGITALFAAYADALNDFDAGAIVDLFAFPNTIWQFGKGHVFADADDLLENVETLLKAFDGAGVVTSSFHLDSSHCLETGSSAHATASWTQQDAEGETIHAFRCTYLLLLDNGELFIASVVNEPEDD